MAHFGDIEAGIRCIAETQQLPYQLIGTKVWLCLGAWKAVLGCPSQTTNRAEHGPSPSADRLPKAQQPSSIWNKAGPGNQPDSTN